MACQLSVVIPCRDYGHYLDDAIRSVLEQASVVPDLEVIVVDDHSSAPDTLAVLSRWGGADARVRVTSNPGRRGAAAARNVGIAEASGDWVAFLDADDVWEPGGLESRWQVVQRQAGIEWLGADFLRWHADGSVEGEAFFKSRGLPRRRPGWTYDSGEPVRLARPVAEFLRASLAWTGAVMVCRTLLHKVGGFEERLGNFEDHHLWLRLAQAADFVFVPRVVARYRQHPGSVSREPVPPAHWFIKALRLLEQEPAFQPYRRLLRRKLAIVFEQNAGYHRARGERWMASLAAAQAVSYDAAKIQKWRGLVAAALGRR